MDHNLEKLFRRLASLFKGASEVNFNTDANESAPLKCKSPINLKGMPYDGSNTGDALLVRQPRKLNPHRGGDEGLEERLVVCTPRNKVD